MRGTDSGVGNLSMGSYYESQQQNSKDNGVYGIVGVLTDK